ncbi:uncharacterized protein LOC117103797 [Anneissia japonica]|uniref:uncharacterized protein LOC117103797 n=1 Tax=Anneissia japonica TaxID=1529436 RepID=UPI0014257B5F|nr:uncharacterized protein LOC117103797 [Anneissia japonica]
MKLSVVLFIISLGLGVADRPISDTIAALSKRVASFQAVENKNYTPPMSWGTSKGAYRSDIRINWHGSPFLAFSRDYLACYDTNSFSTLWITTALIEAYSYGNASRPDEDQMMNALKAINLFHNKNNPAGNGAMNFWSQIYNKSSGMWISRPENVFEGVQFIQKYTPFKLLQSIFKYFNWEAGLQILEFFERANGYFSAFLIPSDFDDTFLNIGLGALLKSTKASFPTLYNIWAKNNTHYETAFRDLKKYAYRPMNIDLDANAIDTRTYYYLRGFLEEAKKNGQTVSLVTTNVQNITEERYLSSRGVSMPFHINNVDTTVAANSIYGLTTAVLFNLSSSNWFDMEIQTIYANTTSLIEWLIEHNVIEERPDLALTYYPSRYSFYYYVARTLFILETQYVSEGTLPMEILNQTRTKFKRVLQGKASEMILSEANPDGNGLYFEEFLGNGDTDFSGAPMVSCYFSENITIQIDIAISFLVINVPFYFPTNHIEFLNGTILPSNTSKFDRNMFIAISGVIGEEEYEDLLKITHFGKMTPTNFTGYNDPNAVFPFWTSDAYTYANTLLALAQFQNLNS